MSDLRPTIVPKSDQLNADDLIGRTMTIKITSVSVRVDEQPVSIHFEGDNGKPYKPGKSMRRVLVNVWGHDSNNYIGRSLTLYRDEKVTFGGLAVGGIRISHMSDIPREMTMALTMSRANKKPFVVRPLVAEARKMSFSEWISALEVDLSGASDVAERDAILARPDVRKAMASATGAAKERLEKIVAEATGRAELAAAEEQWTDNAPDAAVERNQTAEP